MEKIIYCALFGLLVACNANNNISYTPYHNLDNPYKESFYNEAAVQNSNITGMISRNSIQVESYIQNKLQGYEAENKSAAKNISSMDVANAALKLSIATDEEISNMYNENKELLRQALYVTNSYIMNKCMEGATATNTATCYVNWRNSNPKAISSLYENAQVLTINEASFNATDGTSLKFIVDDDTGKITGISVLDGTDTMNISDSVYSGQFWASMPNDKIILLDYISLGKTYGLSYSDFGVYAIYEDTPIENGFEHKTLKSNVPFAGGYDSQKIAKSAIATNVHFTGQAVGNARDSQHRVDLSGTATLTFDKESGTSTLRALFNNWYDIQVTDNGAIEFINYTNKNNLVKLNATPDSDGVITDTGAKMDVGYYAPKPDTGVPTEATGLIQYTETASGVKMDIAFGAK